MLLLVWFQKDRLWDRQFETAEDAAKYITSKGIESGFELYENNQKWEDIRFFGFRNYVDYVNEATCVKH